MFCSHAPFFFRLKDSQTSRHNHWATDKPYLDGIIFSGCYTVCHSIFFFDTTPDSNETNMAKTGYGIVFGIFFFSFLLTTWMFAAHAISCRFICIRGLKRIQRTWSDHFHIRSAIQFLESERSCDVQVKVVFIAISIIIIALRIGVQWSAGHLICNFLLRRERKTPISGVPSKRCNPIQIGL